ncbi:alkaline phosphatase [Histidinibacterium aquaticum]|uniref:Alkaline phosphatase n=1 Tax=Histidinibacterium aquaticum TaxID=2613962 RepID=A0A5J5GCR0_9RHOB|nr:alkaline phosphatase [Histidinibacterium aquaticum]KAA9005956.1 alkaline phosphatase [Histidinibacterium aquaticum]
MKTISVSAVALLAAGAVSAQGLPQADSDWFVAGETTIQEILDRQPNTNTARNVILMVADGNGVGTNYATRLFMGQQEGGLGEDYVLPFETTDWAAALVKTYNINAQTPDSAPTAGAMNTGVKQRFNLINLGEEAIHDDCSTVEGNELTLLSEMMTEAGRSVGIVSTARVTHATPAAVYAKTANRNWEDSVPEDCTAQADIATQLIDAMEAGIIDLAMGGGARHFLPEGTDGGRRTDGVNLVERATGLGAQWATNTEEFEGLTLDGETPILALFEDSHMQYEYDRTDEPSISEMTAAAIEYLSQNEEGYFLEVEAGRVDHASHAGNLFRTLTDGAAFMEAVATADEMTDDSDTLIIVTADHEHALAFNGYCGRGSDITGLCYGIAQEGIEHTDEPNLGSDGLPYTVAGFLNGAGSVLVEQLPEEGETEAPTETETGEASPEESAPIYSGSRSELTQEEATDPDYLQQALIPMSSETHSGEDVAVYAKGPFAHLFDGTIEQNVIFHVMNHAAFKSAE